MGSGMEYATCDAAMIGLRLAALVAAAGSLTLANTGCTTQASEKAMTVNDWKSELDSRLVRGASAADVEAYLKAKGLENSGLIDNAELAHMGFDPNTFELKTMIRGTRKSLLVTTDLAATFIFDRDKKLIETRVEEVHTGL